MLWWKFSRFVSFLEAKVSFRSNFLSILSAIKHNSSLLSKLKHYIHWSKAALLKRIFFEIFECLGQICQIPHVNFEVNSFSNFKSFVIVVTHNSPVSFKLTYFLLWIKNPIKVQILRLSSAQVKICQILHVIFQTRSHFFFKCASFSNVMKDNSSVAQTLYILVKSSPLKCKFLGLSSARVKILQIPYVNFQTASQFLFRFFIISKSQHITPL